MKSIQEIRTPYTSQKTKNNRKDIMKFWLTYNSSDEYRESRITENYSLLNSLVDSSRYNANLDLIMEGESVSLGYPTMQHFGLIAKVAEAAIGEAILSNIPLSVRDNSNGRHNEVRRVKEELIKNYLYNKYRKPLEESILAPIQQQVAAAQQNNIPIDNKKLQEIIQKANDEIISKTPQEINDYIDNDFQTQPEGFSQRLLNKLSDLCELPSKRIEALEDVLALAECYFLPSINHNIPELRTINPKNINVVYSPKSPFVQDAIAAIVKDKITFQDALAMDGEYLTKGEIKKLINNLGVYSGNSYDKTIYNERDEEVIKAAHYNKRLANELSKLDMDYYDDQLDMASIYSSIISNYDNSSIYLNRYYITWRETVYFNRVKSRNPNTGDFEYRWEAEHYVLNPAVGDISLQSVEKPQVWHGVLYDVGDDVITCKVEPVPNQYKSMEDIHNVNLPIFGGKLNTRKGNADNRAPVDNGKVWNYEFDILMAEYKLKQSSNFGNVFLLFRELKPDDIPWGDWFATMKHMKMLILSNNNEDKSIDPQLVSYLKSVDISTISEIQSILNMSNFFLRNVYEFMGYSPERLGTINQYMTSSNAQESINASKIQTLRLYDIFDKQYLAAINYLFNISKSALKDNKYLRELLLNDVDQAYVITEWDQLDSSQMGVNFSVSPDTIQKIRDLKRNSLALIQNQLTDLEDFIAFYLSDTTTDLRNVSKSIQQKKAKLNQAASDAETAKIQQLMAQEMQKFNQQVEVNKQLQAQKDKAALDRTMIDSTKFQKTVDINQNQINDAYETKLLEMDFNNKKLKEEIAIKNRELDLKEKELELKRSK